ncbi:MAG: hypothetical protein H6Q35_2658 [Proteobacteria bacterium]|nr:hypothetical protein [Pseudomonadota bacterium]
MSQSKNKAFFESFIKANKLLIKGLYSILSLKILNF